MSIVSRHKISERGNNIKFDMYALHAGARIVKTKGDSSGTLEPVCSVRGNG